MKLLLSRMIVFLVTLVLLGMGSIGGVPEGTIPDVDKDFAVKLIDRDGVATEITQFSIDGNTYLVGTRGQGQVTVQMQDLIKLEFGNVSANEVQVRCTLRDDTQVELKVRKRSVFYGKGGFGVFQIHARHIKQIVFP